MSLLETKVVRKKKLDKDLTVRVLRNEAAERIYVEFSSKDGKIVLQKSFQDNFRGKLEAESFEGAFQTIGDLKKHFGFKQEK